MESHNSKAVYFFYQIPTQVHASILVQIGDQFVLTKHAGSIYDDARDTRCGSLSTNVLTWQGGTVPHIRMHSKV